MYKGSWPRPNLASKVLIHNGKTGPYGTFLTKVIFILYAFLKPKYNAPLRSPQVTFSLSYREDMLVHAYQFLGLRIRQKCCWTYFSITLYAVKLGRSLQIITDLHYFFSIICRLPECIFMIAPSPGFMSVSLSPYHKIEVTFQSLFIFSEAGAGVNIATVEPNCVYFNFNSIDCYLWV